MKLSVALLGAVFALATIETTASADVTDDITVGIGTGVGVTHSKDLGDEAYASVGAEVNLKVKAFEVIALEAAISTAASDVANQRLVFDSRFRLSALIYVVPTDYFGLYLKTGIGALDVGDLASVTAETNSYHGGAGLDVYLSDNVVIGGEFLILIPGVTSMENAFISHALTGSDSERPEDGDQAAAGGSNQDMLMGLEVSDFISVENFRASLSLRYYF